MTWRTTHTYLLDGTYLEIHPEAAGGWVIVDSRNPGVSLGTHLTIDQAKRAAERLDGREPGKYRRAS